MPESAMGRLWRGNPLWPSNPPHPSPPSLLSCSRANRDSAASSTLSSRRLFLHGMKTDGPHEWKARGRSFTYTAPVTAFKMSKIGWLQTSGTYQEVSFDRFSLDSGDTFLPRGLEFGSTMRRSEPWKENMDFARKVWLFLLLKPEELHSGNDAVKLTVSHVSIFCTESSCGCKNM